MVYEQPELIAQDAPILDQKDIVERENKAQDDFDHSEESKHVRSVADRENTEHNAASRSCKKRRWDSKDVNCEEDSESNGPSCSKTHDGAAQGKVRARTTWSLGALIMAGIVSF
jgi:hypothetical protein